VSPSDFDDANRDGRKVLSLYRFRRGFTLDLPSAVSLRRVGLGKFDVEAFEAAKVTVNGQSLPAS